MLRLGLKDFSRHFFTHLFISLQLAAVFFIVIAIVSSIYSRTELYTPVKDILERDGAYAVSATYYSDEGLTLKEKVPEIESYFGITKLELSAVPGDKFLFYAYGGEIMEAYQPALAEGSWIDGRRSESGAVPAVVNYESELKVGDTVSRQYFRYREDDVTFTDPDIFDVDFIIVGRLKKEVPLFGLNSYTNADDDFRDLYDTYSSTTHTLMLVSEAAANDAGVHTYPVFHQIVLFKEGLTEEQIKEAVINVNRCTGFAVSLEVFRGNSKKYVYEQLIRLAPILISIVLLVLVSTVSITALITKMNMRANAIYSLLGCTMRRCSLIHLTGSLLTSFLAMMLCILAFRYMSFSGLLEETVIRFDEHALLWCGAVWAGFMLCSMLSPMIALSRATVKEHLAANE